MSCKHTRVMNISAFATGELDNRITTSQIGGKNYVFERFVPRFLSFKNHDVSSFSFCLDCGRVIGYDNLIGKLTDAMIIKLNNIFLAQDIDGTCDALISHWGDRDPGEVIELLGFNENDTWTYSKVKEYYDEYPSVGLISITQHCEGKDYQLLIQMTKDTLDILYHRTIEVNPKDFFTMFFGGSIEQNPEKLEIEFWFNDGKIPVEKVKDNARYVGKPANEEKQCLYQYLIDFFRSARK